VRGRQAAGRRQAWAGKTGIAAGGENIVFAEGQTSHHHIAHQIMANNGIATTTPYGGGVDRLLNNIIRWGL